jgi:2-polyprenyl-6-methoxyphenol hydroxylase-like FAD-dependent oxidoreductase
VPPIVIAQRRWLHRLLAERLAATEVRTGVHVEAVHPDGRVRTGEGELTADLVVVADGARSTLRAGLFPDHPGVEGVGELAARAVVACPAGFDVQRLPAGELLDHRTGHRFGCMPMADGNVYWYASWPHRHGGHDGDLRGWLLGAFADWHPAVPALVEATAPDAVHVDELVRLASALPSLVAGRVALLGDAAHAMTPDLGQGGGLAFEDAVALGRELAGVQGAAGAAAALRGYDARRRRRTAAMLRASNRMNRLLTLTGPAGRLRNRALRALPGGVATSMMAQQLRMPGAGAGALGSRKGR